ncbi:MAG: ATP-binding protein [Anaerolineales bacterium]
MSLIAFCLWNTLRIALLFAVSRKKVYCVRPCPCGYFLRRLAQKAMYVCAAPVVTKYQKRISGPLLDRIDIHIEVPRVDYEKLSGDRVGGIFRIHSPARPSGKKYSATALCRLRNPTLFATRICAWERYVSFASCRMKVRA